MKILFDLATNRSVYSGVSRYALNILEGFVENGVTDITILASPEIYEYVTVKYPCYKCVKSTYKAGAIFSNVINLSRQINKIDCDIVFATVPGKYFLLSRKPVVQTIHDLQYFLQPLTFSIGYFMQRILMPFVLMKSKKIISISNFVKSDIKKKYPFVSKKEIKTIYNSVDIKISGPEQTKKNYILFVSRLEQTKNVLTLLKAFNRIKNETDVMLKLVGKETLYWRTVLYPYIKSNGLENRVSLISQTISDDELINMYKECRMLVHPSLAEGFGYTPVEAAIVGTPVLSSKETSLFETTLGALSYYDDTLDDKELGEKILYVLDNPPSKDELKKISEKFAREYSIRNQAKKVYEYIISGI